MKIAVLMGGVSREREISLRSGENVVKALKKLGHEVVPIDVKEDFFLVLPSLKQFDLVFIALHGKFGEDGTVQALLDWIGVPYTGSGVLASALCFDKLMTYRIVEKFVPVPEYTVIDKPTRESPFGFPCVLKPRREGSSIGVHICDNAEELEHYSQIELSLYGELVLQRYVRGRELTASLIEMDGELRILPILELRPRRRFYDYIAKYTPNMTEFVLPAPLTEEEYRAVCESCLKAFKACECKGFARIDGILKDGIFYFLEINTIPGMTDLSDMPASARAAGMSFEDLIDAIVKTVRR
ncbi:D-alanyl-alanine synthetase [Pseudothermotoga hypogea DSM 11164 = NBRC 106472]|uniref:D-alanine--D-alanine ligase n=1 Tax=Pseudothermotoga hypogea DSM 11164 = NBRC 106472 TaxID=1123384 RepID=A0A0X1KNQ9_9THEM|nr:D-alanine--D-alanine ligase [Pseudothermotoga hypogea]AJC72852.1 D-alanyl-alanine synthetase [Pseudothermotoga hypogea DSM 11164 = NBRC 106472]MBC7122472.1 D-alanine--D-alanine ligase [Pseudothermotoga sp.]